MLLVCFLLSHLKSGWRPKVGILNDGRRGDYSNWSKPYRSLSLRMLTDTCRPKTSILFYDYDTINCSGPPRLLPKSKKLGLLGFELSSENDPNQRASQLVRRSH